VIHLELGNEYQLRLGKKRLVLLNSNPCISRPVLYASLIGRGVPAGKGRALAMNLDYRNQIIVIAFIIRLFSTISCCIQMVYFLLFHYTHETLSKYCSVTRCTPHGCSLVDVLTICTFCLSLLKLTASEMVTLFSKCVG